MAATLVPTTAEEAVLAGHVLAGFLALLAGAGALATTKGGRRHRQLGRVFVYSMAVVAASAVGLYAFERSVLRLFLLLVAVFSYYFVFSGYRVLSRKREVGDADPVDRVAVGLVTVAGLGLLGMGGLMALDGVAFAPVVLVFGAIGTLIGAADLRQFRQESADPGAWLTQHLQRMGAGYIAAVSAFSSVNFLFLPTVVRWLWPTAVGVPLLMYLGKQYERRGKQASPSTA